MIEDAPQTAPAPAGIARRHVLYPNAYVWFVFLAAMDVMCTYLVMHPGLFYQPDAAEQAVIAATDGEPVIEREPRGRELNPLAAGIIERYGVPGKVVYKFSLVMLVIVICEIVGRVKYATGQRLAEWAVALTSIPVVVAIVQMVVDRYK